MATVLKIDLCQASNCKTLKFYETTGTYTTLTTTGWGTPNSNLADATAASLTITTPAGVENVINLFTNGFPSNIPTFYYPLDSTAIGDTTATAFPDGVYTFTYEVTMPDEVLTTTIRKLLYCQAECCVYGMLAAIDDPECDCAKDSMEAAIKAYNLLQGLKHAASCGLVSTFTDLLAVLNRLCNNSNCTTCQ